VQQQELLIMSNSRQSLLHNSTSLGIFDAIQVRGEAEFHRQMDKHKFSVQDIYVETSKILPLGSTAFVATDIKKLQYFDYLQQHYNLVFLQDCQNILEESGKIFLLLKRELLYLYVGALIRLELRLSLNREANFEDVVSRSSLNWF
jgi:hypothetical protein